MPPRYHQCCRLPGTKPAINNNNNNIFVHIFLAVLLGSLSSASSASPAPFPVPVDCSARCLALAAGTRCIERCVGDGRAAGDTQETARTVPTIGTAEGDVDRTETETETGGSDWKRYSSSFIRIGRRPFPFQSESTSGGSKRAPSSFIRIGKAKSDPADDVIIDDVKSLWSSKSTATGEVTGGSDGEDEQIVEEPFQQSPDRRASSFIRIGRMTRNQIQPLGTAADRKRLSSFIRIGRSGRRQEQQVVGTTGHTTRHRPSSFLPIRQEKGGLEIQEQEQNGGVWPLKRASSFIRIGRRDDVIGDDDDKSQKEVAANDVTKTLGELAGGGEDGSDGSKPTSRDQAKRAPSSFVRIG
jgi:hypothetical protein